MVDSPGISKKLARQPDHMKKLITALRSCPRQVQEEDSPPPLSMELARTPSMSLSSQELLLFLVLCLLHKKKKPKKICLLWFLMKKEPAAADPPPLELDDDEVIFMS